MLKSLNYLHDYILLNIKLALLNRNSTLCKFHTVKNWYQILTTHDKLVPIGHIFRTNFSYFVKNTHEVKFHIVYMHIPSID